jgi:hypothetical protein
MSGLDVLPPWAAISPDDVLNKFIAEDLAQRGDVNPDDAIFDVNILPDRLFEIGDRDDVIVVLDQDAQDVEGAITHDNPLTRLFQKTGSRPQLEQSELEDPGSRNFRLFHHDRLKARNIIPADRQLTMQNSCEHYPIRAYGANKII